MRITVSVPLPLASISTSISTIPRIGCISSEGHHRMYRRRFPLQLLMLGGTGIRGTVRLPLLLLSSSYSSCYSSPLSFQRQFKGDYGFNVFHNSNPQHGGSYARHERRMRADEVEDFLKSVRGWQFVDECRPGSSPNAMLRFEDHLKEFEAQKNQQHVIENGKAGEETRGRSEENNNNNNNISNSKVDEEIFITESIAEEAIMRTFRFETFKDAYLFMGRVWAFCYGSDKYPHITWQGTNISVFLYSPSFRGISKREARLAAFLNDQYNMMKKSTRQQKQIFENVIKKSRMERQMGEEVKRTLAQREEQRTSPLKEQRDGPTRWSDLL